MPWSAITRLPFGLEAWSHHALSFTRSLAASTTVVAFAGACPEVLGTCSVAAQKTAPALSASSGIHLNPACFRTGLGSSGLRPALDCWPLHPPCLFERDSMLLKGSSMLTDNSKLRVSVGVGKALIVVSRQRYVPLCVFLRNHLEDGGKLGSGLIALEVDGHEVRCGRSG
jgi:hypothetical protein